MKRWIVCAALAAACVTSAAAWAADKSPVKRVAMGQDCPKAGYYRADVPADVPHISHYLDKVIQCTPGTRMPRLDVGDPYDDARVRWVWIGPLDGPAPSGI